MSSLYFTYILYSVQHDRFYIGQTGDLRTRLSYHNGGKVKSSKSYLPWEMVWYQIHESRAHAMGRERKLKNLKSQKRIILYINKVGKVNPKCSAEFFLKNSSVLAESKNS